MHIFLSHSKVQSAIAERLALSLRGDGHTVFFDRSDIDAGEEYDSRIRRAIEACDLFVFMISPESVALDSYPLAELGIAEERWAHPKGHVLPLVVQPVDVGLIPPYLRAVSIFDPPGDFVAESSAAIARFAKKNPRLLRPVPATIVAVLVLTSLTVWMVYKRFERNREVRLQVSRVIASANTDVEAGEYTDAFRGVTDATARFPDDVELRKMRERVAMLWLRNIRVRVGEQTFTQVVNTLRPVLNSGASAATGETAGDLYAHLGWCEYLRTRDGTTGTDPVRYFKRAIEADRSNPYAHAMWGFWILFNNGALGEAQTHFQLAVAGGRDSLWIRNLQIGALLLNHNPTKEREAIRIANAMRLDRIPVQQPSRLWSIYEDGLLRAEDTEDFLHVIPPADHVMTFRWLFPEPSASEREPALYRFLVGRLEEAAGNREFALSSYRWVESYFRRSRSTGPLLDRALEGLGRLK